MFSDITISLRSVKKSLIAAFTMEDGFISCFEAPSHFV